MATSNIQINNLRKERGWSQEKLAAISGLSERTIQRVEKDGTCSLDTRMALAIAFEIPPTALLGKNEKLQKESEYITDWSGAFGLAILGMAVPIIILLTGIDGIWEVVSFLTVIGGTIILSIMTYGAGNTYNVFDKTSWIVRYPLRVSGLNTLILHAKSIISNAYLFGVITSLVAGLTLAVHKPEILVTSNVFFPIIIKPILYSILFVEFWFRPYKRKMERMLINQRDN